jgi:hypothetical protein
VEWWNDTMYSRTRRTQRDADVEAEAEAEAQADANVHGQVETMVRTGERVIIAASHMTPEPRAPTRHAATSDLLVPCVTFEQ